MEENKLLFWYLGLSYQFLKPPPNNVVCSACSEVMQNPMTTDCCGKHFCRDCIQVAYSYNDFECPLCDIEYIDAASNDEIWENILNLLVKCPFSHNGCNWTGQLKASEVHVEENCEYADNHKCTKCGCSMLKIKLEEHIAELCPKRPATCTDCNKEGTFDEISGRHRNECPIKYIGDNLCFLEFIEPPPIHCICPQCKKVLRKPMFMESCCKKHFCAACIEDPYSISTTSYNCPVCDKQNITAALDAQKLEVIMELLARCPFSSNGCLWVGSLKKISEHVKEFCQNRTDPNQVIQLYKNTQFHTKYAALPAPVLVQSDTSSDWDSDDDSYLPLTEQVETLTDEQPEISLNTTSKQSFHDFIHPLPANYLCSSCENVLDMPMLTECCSTHFCATCLDHPDPYHFPEVYAGYYCPVCQKDTAALLDSNMWMKILSLVVRCSYLNHGCQWMGELKLKATHIGDCEYAETDCRYTCGVKLPRCKLAEHMGNLCPRRPVNCSYCGIEDEHDIIHEKHMPMCPEFPLQCPNHCGVPCINRNQLGNHLLDCPEEIIECDFSYAGCDKKTQRKYMWQHLHESSQEHLTLQTSFFVAELEKKDILLEELRKEKNQQIEKLCEMHKQHLELLTSQSKTQQERTDQRLIELMQHLQHKQNQLKLNTNRLLDNQ